MKNDIYNELVIFWLAGSIMMLCQLPVTCNAQQLPIKPARTISFETTEATYMDVDLSPDGKTIIFSLLGDIYKVPVSGGNAEQVTRGLSFNRRPVWSSDGKRIAFLSDTSGSNHVNVMNADGTGWQIMDTLYSQSDFLYTGRNMIEWTPDGLNIAFNERLLNMTGGSSLLPIQANDDIQFTKDVIQFSKDRGLMYYFDERNGFMEEYDLHANAIKKLTSLSDSGLNPRISPDGKLLTYVTGPDPESDLRIRNLATGEDHILTHSIEGRHRTMKERYVFTPDSQGLVIGFGGKLHRIDLENGNDTVIPFMAQVNVDLGAFDYNTYPITHDSLLVRSTRSANISPGGNHLVFSALSRVYVMGLPNGRPHLLTDQPLGQFQPVYSPDGKWIAYVTWSDTAGGSLWRVPSSGGKPQRLISQRGCFVDPAWSPKGTQIAVVRGTPNQISGREGVYITDGRGVGHLLIVSITGGIFHDVADSVPLHNHLSFSADGRRILYLPNTREINLDSPVAQLVSTELDGKNRNILAIRNYHHKPLHFGDLGLDKITISPDGRYLVYGINEDLYLIPILYQGRPLTLNDKSGTSPVIRFAKGGMDPNWNKGGRILNWSYGDHFFSIDPDKIVALASGIKKELDNGRIIDIPLKPDLDIVMRLNAPKRYAHGVIALKGVRIISMKGNEVIERGTIVISDGRIAAIGSMKDLQIPSGAKVYDLSGTTAIPGLIDLHDHMDKPNDDFAPQQSWKFLVNLAYGVTTARDPSSSLGSFSCAELLETGQMIGPRLFTVGRAVTPDWEIKNLDDARAIVKKRAMFGASTIKQYLQGTRLQRQWLLIASREAGLNMTNEGSDDPGIDFAMIKDGSTGVEHTPDWGFVYQDVISFLSQSKTWLTPTLQVNDQAKPFFDNQYRNNPDTKLSRFWPSENIKTMMQKPLPKDITHPGFLEFSTVYAALRQHGVSVTVGAHGNEPGIGTHFEIWALQMVGISNMEALQAATILGAEGLGVQKDLGSLEVGKIADLIVLDKNPLEDIHNTKSIRYVMKDGVLYESETLDEVWPKKKKCPEWRYKSP
jgi:Tol biopolymer transport system component